jgi:NAD(P)-dependent dehydrogenase (short-subunit alcohol dehydrogenase family)/uncharacterized glyoxalase superfamily protein PhnB
MSGMSTAVVTGAASGIGLALASQLSRAGHLVHLADLSPTDETAAQLHGVPHHVDVANEADMARLAQEAAGARIVCLNAGIVGETTGPPWEAPPEEWERVVGVNLGGVVNGLRAFVPRLLEAGDPAHIVITASLAGVLTFPGGGVYAASKHAVLAVAEQAAQALVDTNVTVTVVCPALVRSAMSEIGADPMEVAADALAAAEAGRFLVMPRDWEPAVRARTDSLLVGAQPRVPSPATAASVDPSDDEHTAPGRVLQMRLVVEAPDYDDAVSFYRDHLGATTELQVHGDAGEQVTILDVGRATLELSNPAQVAMIDEVEVGRRVAPRLRVAFEVADVDSVTRTLADAGAEVIADPTVTPWRSRNARLNGPGDLQLTIFEELD